MRAKLRTVSFLSAILMALMSGGISFATPSHVRARSAGGDWLSVELPSAIRRLTANISPPGAHLGAVIASPQNADPDYYFHWIRDAALVMDAMGAFREQSSDPALRSRIEQMLVDYAAFSRLNQTTQTLTGLGEPKFYVQGPSFMGSWARPQNDGPALRALALIRFANQMLDEGHEAYVRSSLYDGLGNTRTVIKVDLEYVSHHWRNSSFDLWEEVRGDHFYTRMVQRKALLWGAILANRLGDPGAASWYNLQARALEGNILRHWDPFRGIVVATLNRTEGVDYKSSGLDVAVVLGALHGDAGDGFFTVRDPRIQATMGALQNSFRGLYPVNSFPNVPGVAIGRYPEDRYAGADFNGGNPWVLATLAFAEAHYRIGGPEHIALAQAFVDRVAFHAPGDGSLAEQIQRSTGFMTSANNLSWNYAAVLTTIMAKNAPQSGAFRRSSVPRQ